MAYTDGQEIQLLTDISDALIGPDSISDVSDSLLELKRIRVGLSAMMGLDLGLLTFPDDAVSL